MMESLPQRIILQVVQNIHDASRRPREATRGDLFLGSYREDLSAPVVENEIGRKRRRCERCVNQHE
jgi:hypothetical protein